MPAVSPDGLLWAVFKGWDRYAEIAALSMEVEPIETLITKDGTMCTASKKEGCVKGVGCCVPWAAQLPMQG